MYRYLTQLPRIDSDISSQPTRDLLRLNGERLDIRAHHPEQCPHIWLPVNSGHRQKCQPALHLGTGHLLTDAVPSSKYERLLEQYNISVLKPNGDFLFAVALVFDYKYGCAPRIPF